MTLSASSKASRRARPASRPTPRTRSRNGIRRKRERSARSRSWTRSGGRRHRPRRGLGRRPAPVAAQARRTADALGGMIAGEDFEVAAADAARARDALASATASAAAAKGQDLRRREVGEAIMDALEDLGFDISYEDGTRDERLPISGQVADATGRGDFDIEIPLDGEVDFEVTAEAGDVSCVNAIRSCRSVSRSAASPGA